MNYTLREEEKRFIIVDSCSIEGMLETIKKLRKLYSDIDSWNVDMSPLVDYDYDNITWHNPVNVVYTTPVPTTNKDIPITGI